MAAREPARCVVMRFALSGGVAGGVIWGVTSWAAGTAVLAMDAFGILTYVWTNRHNVG